jgi:hypothetical protein
MKALPNKVVDLPDGVEQPWAYAIGGLILNFGSIEMGLIRLVEVISLKDEKRNEAIRKLLSGRIAFVIELLESSGLSPELKARIHATLAEVRQLASLRNTIAHNPFVFGRNWLSPPF